VLALAGLYAGLPGPSARAGPPPTGRQNLKAKQEALGEVRRQLDEARARASAARRREISLLAELEGIDRSLAQKRGALQQLDRRIVQVEAELDALEGRRDRVVEDLVSQQAALSARFSTRSPGSRRRPRGHPGLPGGDSRVSARSPTWPESRAMTWTGSHATTPPPTV
jgi:septal ring factor EnvC (AmiA/AmiB activator)